ncbi:hypothetical protein F4561_002218 [Lipingzhangella halophila]|uniref:Uncharacterized protein n=1 Tax=Lipingzhangella halophila TaxID=1783352 RepID=A0A7W7RG67_9ACTN|nr:hypothetical protein [Lipingzhangella halophila]MBB4931398.1 hypothetical protein [Lipingzhangella halophila]
MNISVPDVLAEQVRAIQMPVSEVCQRALRQALDRSQQLKSTDSATDSMGEITVEVDNPPFTFGFIGRWLVEPDRDDTRTGEDGYDAGAYWGVAQTKRGRIAVYTAHCNDRWPAQLNDHDTLDEAAKELPEDILAMAARELGEDLVVWRDI